MESYSVDDAREFEPDERGVDFPSPIFPAIHYGLEMTKNIGPDRCMKQNMNEKDAPVMCLAMHARKPL